MGNTKFDETLGLPLTTTKRLLRKLRSGDSQWLIFGRPPGAEACLCLVLLSSCVTSQGTRGFSVGIPGIVKEVHTASNPALPRKAVLSSTNHDRPRRSE